MSVETLATISRLDSGFAITIRASDLVNDSLSIKSDGGRDLLNLGSTTYSVSNDEELTVKSNSDGKLSDIENFNGLIAGDCSVSSNGRAATLTDDAPNLILPEESVVSSIAFHDDFTAARNDQTVCIERPRDRLHRTPRQIMSAITSVPASTLC